MGGVEGRRFINLTNYASEFRFRKIFPLIITAFVIFLLALPYYIDDVNDNDEYPSTTPSSPNNNDHAQIQNMSCPHYKTALFIFSEVEHVNKRMLMREELFGITDNIIPCMKQDTTEIFYKFFVRKPKGNINENILYLYTSERLEYDYDVVEIDVQSDHDWHQSLLQYAQSLQENCTTFDHLMLIDIFTMINLEKFQDKILTSATEMDTQRIVWGSFDSNRTENMAAIIGSSAIQPILNNLHFKSNYTDILSSLYLYHYENPDKEIPGGLIFINDPMSIIEWPNSLDNIDCISCVIAIGHIYQDWEVRKIKKELNISTTLPCYARLDLKPYSIETSKLRPNIAVITSSYLYDKCMLEAAPLSAQNKREYAEKYGYAFISRSTEFAQQTYRVRRAVWGKIDAIEKILPYYEWVLWLDMDAIFVNRSLTVEHFLKIAEKKIGGKAAFEDINVIVARPVGDRMLNAGVLLFRNSIWTKNFLRRGVQPRYDLAFAASLEQQAIRDAIKRPSWKQSVLKFENDHSMNTFPDRYVRGDYIVHYAPVGGCPAKYVISGLSKVELLEESPNALISMPF